MGYPGAEKAACLVLQSEGGVIGQQVRPLLCLVPALESASPTGSQASQHPEPAAPPPPFACPYTCSHSALSCLSPSSVDPSLSAHPVTLWPMRPCRPGLRAGQMAQVPRSQAQLSEWTPSWGHSQIPVPCRGGPRLPSGVVSGCQACTQASQPLFVQAKVSPPPPGQLGLDQWPRAIARLSGPCPLWPVAPGSMGLLLSAGQHCDCSGKQSRRRKQVVPAPPHPVPWAPWRLAGRCRRPELSLEARCLVTFLPGYSPWSPRAWWGGGAEE